jgi:hypothetical protein
MAAKSQTLDNAVLAAVLQNAGYTGGKATLYVALKTTVSTPMVPGTETTDANYARLPITSATGWNPTPPTAGTVSNVASIGPFFNVGGVGAATGATIVEIAVYDQLSGGNELYFGSCGSKVVGVGDTASIAASALNITEG